MSSRALPSAIRPKPRSFVVIDAKGSSEKNDRDQVAARGELYGMVMASFGFAGIQQGQLDFLDRGDGMIAIVSPEVSKADLLMPFIDNLNASLSEYNRRTSSDLWIILRMTIHGGELYSDSNGWVGSELNLAYGLNESKEIRAHLERHPGANFVLAVFDHVYRSIVAKYPEMHPERYEAATLDIKGVNSKAWFTCRPWAS